MRITTKGQVTIPQPIREAAGLMPGTDVTFRVEGGTVRLVKTTKPTARATRGQKLVAGLRGVGDFRMTTDEVMARMRGPVAEDG